MIMHRIGNQPELSILGGQIRAQAEYGAVLDVRSASGQAVRNGRAIRNLDNTDAPNGWARTVTLSPVSVPGVAVGVAP